MFEILLDSEEEEEDDEHLMVSWKPSPHQTKKPNPPPPMKVSPPPPPPPRAALALAPLHSQVDDPGRETVVCLDSDSDSEEFVGHWRLKTCLMATRSQEVATTIASTFKLNTIEELKASDAAIGSIDHQTSTHDQIQCISVTRVASKCNEACRNIVSTAQSTPDEVNSAALLAFNDRCDRWDRSSIELSPDFLLEEREADITSDTGKKNTGGEIPRRPELLPQMWCAEESNAERPCYFDQHSAERPEEEAAAAEKADERRLLSRSCTDELKVAGYSQNLEEKESKMKKDLEEQLEIRSEKEAATFEKEDERRDLFKKCRDDVEVAKKQKKLQEKEDAKQKRLEERAAKKLEKEEEKRRRKEENEKRKEKAKRLREEARGEAAARKKAEQEKEKWDKGKFALQNTSLWIDCKVVESGLIGGHLLNRLAEKDFKFHLVTNRVEKTIIWKMKRPSALSSEMSFQGLEYGGMEQTKESVNDSGSCTNFSQVALEEIELPYVTVVLEAEEFSSMVSQETLDTHIRRVQSHFPGSTICFIINKLKWFLQKKDQSQYKLGESGWVRPNVEQALAQLITNYTGVHSRLCLDEAEVADHVAGLTKSLAECPFKPRLTRLSVSKNGDHVVKNDPNKEVIKKDIWLKALVALPKVSGSCAMAIAKKYPTMRSLLDAYLDPSLTIHRKEFLLQDLLKEGLLTSNSNSGRRVGPACSQRVFRILMAQNGGLKTDDVEDGADMFED